MGETLRIGRRTGDAVFAFARAIELYERKGNVVGAGRVRFLQDDLALV
jgi:hypothetical protein